MRSSASKAVGTYADELPQLGLWQTVQQIPFIFWMIGATLALALGTGMSAPQTISTFNQGFGYALGEFALILLPAFTLAAALAHTNHRLGKRTLAALVGLAPASGAGMVCPDTAYAALAPAAARHKLAVAFGSYAGFKLLFPAGPLLVATALGVQDDPRIIWVGLLLALPVWAVGLLWARGVQPAPVADDAVQSSAYPTRTRWSAWMFSIGPFLVLFALIGLGMAIDLAPLPLLDFLTRPKGALITAALLSLVQLPRLEWRASLEQASRRTAGLLLLIGSASALGAVLTTQFDPGAFAPGAEGQWLILYLFVLTMLFKLIQGSSMATFAAITPIAAPVIHAASLSPILATFAICLGSFIAILPNDSFYWLVRRDALAHISSEPRAIMVLAGGAVLQALTGLLLLWALAQWIS